MGDDQPVQIRGPANGGRHAIKGQHSGEQLDPRLVGLGSKLVGEGALVRVKKGPNFTLPALAGRS